MDKKSMADLEKELEHHSQRVNEIERQMEEKRKEEAATVHADVSQTLTEYVEVFTRAQRNGLIKILDGGATSAKKSSGTGRKIPMKYEVNGIQWSGRGHIPKSFKEWEKTAEGKAFRKKNPDPRVFPLIKDKK